MTEDEFVYISAAAAKAGLTVPSYMVAASMASSGPATMSVTERRAFAAEIFGVVRLIARAAENVNRLTKIAHAQGQVPAEIPAALDGLRRYVDTFHGIVMELDPTRSSR